MIRIDRADFIFENGRADDRETEEKKTRKERAPESDVKIKAGAHLIQMFVAVYNPRARAGRANCSREDSNLHGFPHTVLSRTRLPIPPRERGALNCAECAAAQTVDVDLVTQEK